MVTPSSNGIKYPIRLDKKKETDWLTEKISSNFMRSGKYLSLL